MSHHQRSPLEPAHLVRRLREELALQDERSRPPAGTLEEASGPGVPPGPRTETIEQKAAYALAELLAHDDGQFLRNAYLGILGREPEPGGHEAYRNELSAGLITKVEILGRLRFSAEGRARAVRVKGLLPRYLVMRLCRLPVIGHLLSLALLLFRLPRLAVAWERVETLAATGADRSARVETFAEALEARTSRDLAALSRQVRGHQLHILDQDRRLSLLLEEARKCLAAPLPQRRIEKMVNEADHLLDASLVALEDRFRGTTEDIRQRVSVYVPIVREARAGVPDAPVLDLGCGRGEWLEVLRENRLVARGIDSNTARATWCQERGLDATAGDAVEHLRTLQDASLGAVTAMHVVEHLEFGRMVSLFDEILRVLRPGGIAIFETPNPENLIVGAHTFHLDPYHLRPLPPDLLQGLLEARGFTPVQVLRLHPALEEVAPRSGDPGVQRLLDRHLLGPREYAAIARKP